MIRYYEFNYDSSIGNCISVYSEYDARKYKKQNHYPRFNNAGLFGTLIKRIDVDITKMYASDSENLYTMLSSNNFESRKLAFEFIKGKLCKEDID